MRLPDKISLPLAALMMGSAAIAAPPATGPAADYPVVVGEPFTIGSTVWTPSDQLNYDAVGQAVTGGSDTGEGVTAAHKTLPLPCYVEVTSLETGRTILVRVERRGPMRNDALIELSPSASSQLGIASGSSAPVRVRRVNPPEQERAMLRSGGTAPLRMETPEGLLKVLRRKLADQSPLSPPPSSPPAAPPVAVPKTAAEASGTVSAPADAPTSRSDAVPAAPVARKPEAAKPKASQLTAAATRVTAKAQHPAPKPPEPKPEAGEAKGAFSVQVAAFSSEASARKVAAQLGGGVSRSGRFWRVRMGPYSSRAKAAAALEKARSASYRDARILGAD